jgi:hypothetical protein
VRKLIGDLEALVECPEDVEKTWKESLYKQWSVQEDTYSYVLDRGVKHLPPDDENSQGGPRTLCGGARKTGGSDRCMGSIPPSAQSHCYKQGDQPQKGERDGADEGHVRLPTSAERAAGGEAVSSGGSRLIRPQGLILLARIGWRIEAINARACGAGIKAGPQTRYRR